MSQGRTLIVGGGLCGLALANMLEDAGADYLLVEARDRFGGRIETAQIDNGIFDLGPAWFWPGQPRMAALIARLGLEKFTQYAEGMISIEDAQGHVQHGRGQMPMQGSFRLRGGLSALTDALAARLPPNRKCLNCPVTSMQRDAGIITVQFADGAEQTADRVVLALPPRLAAQITYAPALPATALGAMQQRDTWMAGQAKAVVVYKTPFWREAGHSGDVMSRTGPMVEIHDTSASDSGPFALFGFIGVPPQLRMDTQVLERQIVTQLARIFGTPAESPEAVVIKDWAQDAYTATSMDLVPSGSHGEPTSLPEARTLWEGTLVVSGSETASQFSGYLEGALQAAETSFGHVTSQGN
ncbi:MAG: NAD(P)/FAD-dependent oxidoreductase [Sulfitobacter sp.]